MRKITFSQAHSEAMAETMAKDPTVFAMGEDLARQGGIFGQFKGLPQQFPGRIIDTPISETYHHRRRRRGSGQRRPWWTCTSPTIGVPMDGSSTRWQRSATCSAARPRCPWSCVRPTVLPAAALLAFPVRGVLVRPSRHQGCGALNPYDAKMVLKAAIECDDPTVLREQDPVQGERRSAESARRSLTPWARPVGVERVTIVSYSIGMKEIPAALRGPAGQEGIEAKVIDLITLSLPGIRAIAERVKTHRLTIVHEASCQVSSRGFGAEDLRHRRGGGPWVSGCPILRYGAPLLPDPFAPPPWRRW